MSGGTATLLPRRPLGRTGLNVSELGFNAWVVGGGCCADAFDPGPGEARDEESLAAMAKAFELGVNFVVTADSYGQGRSEILVGKAIKSSPRLVHVATQVGWIRRDPEPARPDFSPGYLRAACDRSLNRLGVTRVDLYLLQRPPREALADESVWNVLRELKDSGKIAHFGVSLDDPADGLPVMERGEVAALDVRYSLGCTQAAQILFAEAEKRGVGILVREPLAGGLLTGRFAEARELPEHDSRRRRYSRERLEAALALAARLRSLAQGGRTAAQCALRFALAPLAVSCVTVGARNAEQAAEDFTASAVAELTPEELARCAG